MRASCKILAFIPCYNEAPSIGNLLREFSALEMQCDTLVIDDGSSDDSAAIAQSMTYTIRFPHNRGVPAVIKEAMGYALSHGYDYCIQMDGDGQHIPAEIAAFMAALEQPPTCNILIGSRYLKRAAPIAADLRRLAGSLVSLAIYLRIRRQWIYDPLSGMRMFDSHAMRYLHEHIDLSQPDALILPQLLSAGFTAQEVKVRMRPRLHGTSYVGGINGFFFLLRLLRRIFAIRTP